MKNISKVKAGSSRGGEVAMKLLFLPLLLAGIILLFAAPSQAVHLGSGPLVCGGCHTMHSSQGATTMGVQGGVPFLIRGFNTDGVPGERTRFCLQCHSSVGLQAAVVFNTGTRTTVPPKVHLQGKAGWGNETPNTTLPPVPMQFDGIGSGGDFSAVFDYSITGNLTHKPGDDMATGPSLGHGHSVGYTTSITPPGNAQSGTPTWSALPGGLSCTSCHDPHGKSSSQPKSNNVNVFRNLKANNMVTGVQNTWTNMATFGDLATSYVGGVGPSNSNGTNPTANVDGNYNVWPVWQSTALQNAYFTTTFKPNTNNFADDDGRYVGISAFCGECHGGWHEGITQNNKSGAGADWRRHPVNNKLVDTTLSSGSNVPIVDWLHYNYTGDTSRAPYTLTDATKNPAAQGASYAQRYYADDSGDKVFCLSCHFAHAGPFFDNLRWNYTYFVDVQAGVGVESGNQIPSNLGCQQCHNRGGQ